MTRRSRPARCGRPRSAGRSCTALWVWPLMTMSIASSRLRDDVDRTARAVAGVGDGTTWPASGPALVEQHHDRLDALLLSFGTRALTVSASSRNSSPGCRTALTIFGVPSSVMPMKPTFTPSNCGSCRPGRRLARACVDDVGREVLEVGAREPVAVLAAIDRVAAAVLHAQQLVDALVELVVAHGGDVQPERVQRLDRRLVVEGAPTAAGWRRSCRPPTTSACSDSGARAP